MSLHTAPNGRRLQERYSRPVPSQNTKDLLDSLQQEFKDSFKPSLSSSLGGIFSSIRGYPIPPKSLRRTVGDFTLESHLPLFARVASEVNRAPPRKTRAPSGVP